MNQWAADHTTALAGGQPILALDMYEHSYHLDFGSNGSLEDLSLGHRKRSVGVNETRDTRSANDRTPFQAGAFSRERQVDAQIQLVIASG